MNTRAALVVIQGVKYKFVVTGTINNKNGMEVILSLVKWKVILANIGSRIPHGLQVRYETSQKYSNKDEDELVSFKTL